MRLVSALLFALPLARSQSWDRTCIIPAAGDGTDDGPAIRQAFQDCGQDGRVVFQENTTYEIQTVLQLHNLSNVQVDLRGTLLVRKCKLVYLLPLRKPRWEGALL